MQRLLLSAFFLLENWQAGFVLDVFAVIMKEKRISDFSVRGEPFSFRGRSPRKQEVNRVDILHFGGRRRKACFRFSCPSGFGRYVQDRRDRAVCRQHAGDVRIPPCRREYARSRIDDKERKTGRDIRTGDGFCGRLLGVRSARRCFGKIRKNICAVLFLFRRGGRGLCFGRNVFFSFARGVGTAARNAG